jgi:hypothetical protein
MTMIPNAPRSFSFDLGATADAIRQTVFDFPQQEIAPRAAEIDRTNVFPRDLWPPLGELGLHGITVEEEHPCAAQAIDDGKTATKNIALEKFRIVPPIFDRTMVRMFSRPVNARDRSSMAQPRSNGGYRSRTLASLSLCRVAAMTAAEMSLLKNRDGAERR